jgi:putative ABC transport system ATP-binding protein
MNIALRQLYPVSFTPVNDSKSDLWKKEVILDSPGKYLLIASSGSGKSTLSGFLYGFRTDYSGELSIDGKTSSSFSITEWTELRKNKLAIVFQDLRLFEQLTVEENLNVKAKLTNEKLNIDTKDGANRLGILNLFARKVSTLSMGQKQRVAILRALLQPFEFLIMDEPFSHLDPANAQNAIQFIHETCQQQNAGFLLTSLNDTYGFNYTRVLYL